MNYRKSQLAIAMVALAVSGFAMADGPAWTYVQGQYRLADSESDGSNYQYGIGGSIGFAEVVHASAKYNLGNFEAGSSVDTDVDTWEIHAGAHFGVTDSADVYAEAIYGNVDIDDADDGDFYGGAFGVRAMLADSFEINGGIEAVQIDDEAFGCSGSGCDDSTETSLFIGGRYAFTPNFSVGVTAVDDNVRHLLDDSVEFDLRWAFGDL